MSKPGTIYRINWQSYSLTNQTTGEPQNDLQCYVDISDNDNLIDDADTELIISLDGAGEPCRPSVVDNDENPFTVILAQQLTIKFNSTTSVNMSTFISGSDQRWGVHYYLGTNTQTIFKGFLVSGDNAISEEFLYPPNVVTLTANDGLPLLKDIALVNADDENPTYWHKISDYLSWALRKTGMDLSLFAAFNIKSVDDVSDISVPNTDPEHFFYVEYLEAKTYEKEIGSCISCYEVIEIILGHEARLFQFQGKWWVVRVDEIEDATRGLYVTEFDSSGSFVANLGEFTFVKSIGSIEDIIFSHAETSVTATRAKKSVRLNFMFETPLEIPCNIDFSRGTIFSDTPTLKKYSIECWTKLYKDGTGDHASAANMYIETQLVDDYETNRYLHFEDNGVFNFIMSEGIPVNEGDRFNISVNRRMESNHGTGGIDNCVQLRLYGDDGTYWTHHGKNGSASTDADVAYWVQCDSLFQTNQKFHGFEMADDYDDTVSIGLYSGEGGSVPTAGSIKILIYVSSLWGATEDTYIEDAYFEYLPYINGSFQRYTGQYHSTSQSGSFKAKIEEQVYMSDSPKKIFKGALFEFDGSDYNLSGLFYNAAVYPSGPPSSDWHHRYGEIQLFDVWNQHKTEKRVIQGTMQGIDLEKTFTISGDILPFPAHLVSKWNFTDTSDHVLNKFFLLLHFDQDHATGEWGGVFREVVDTTIDKDYSNNEFKYITG